MAVQKKIDTTNNIEDVLAERINLLKHKPSKYDKSQMRTPLIDKVLGKKYDGPKRPREEVMLLDPNITDETVRNKLLSCHSYTTNVKIENKNLQHIERALKLMAEELEATPEMLDIMKKTTMSPKTYHILAFLSNAEVWFRYGHERITRE